MMRLASIISRIEKHKRKAEELIKKKKAYVCFCDRDTMQNLRHEGRACECRDQSVEQNLKFWDEMVSKKFPEGRCTLRLQGDIESDNHVMRDPVLFRISYAEHFRHKDKYCVWPLYDFENSVEDCKYGVTHILRSIEFGKMREELQNHIKKALGCKPQYVKEYGRFNIRGAVTQGRVIRQMIKEGKVSGWDDPSLVTLRALKRRGIVRKTYYELVKEVGVSAAPTNIDWTMISSINRSILDKEAERYFFVEEPIKIKIEGAPEQTLSLKKHPEIDKGFRKFHTNTEFFIDKKDYDKLSDGLHRLMDCLNFIKKGSQLKFHSTDYENFKKNGDLIIHWLPLKDNTDVKILMPDNTIKKGLGESSISNLKEGDIIQFQRFGFCRLDKKQEGYIQFVYAHR